MKFVINYLKFMWQNPHDVYSIVQAWLQMQFSNLDVKLKKKSHSRQLQKRLYAVDYIHHNEDYIYLLPITKGPQKIQFLNCVDNQYTDHTSLMKKIAGPNVDFYDNRNISLNFLKQCGLLNENVSELFFSLAESEVKLVDDMKFIEHLQ